MNIFEQATRQAFRFESPKGFLTVEDLWNLPLISNTGRANLDDIAKALHKKVEATFVSFVPEATPVNKVHQTMLDVVVYIINTKISEAKAAEKAHEVREKKQKIMAIIEQKSDMRLADSSLEELQAMLEAL
ncbi:MAG: hypothetical protein IPN20_04580 [Haliscomenobacter sp.]|nr:hypothetical protein [Haliscomenobacter sp.]